MIERTPASRQRDGFSSALMPIHISQVGPERAPGRRPMSSRAFCTIGAILYSPVHWRRSGLTLPVKSRAKRGITTKLARPPAWRSKRRCTSGIGEGLNSTDCLT